MKEVFANVANPTPTGKVPNCRTQTMDKMNQVIEVSRFDVGSKANHTATLRGSKTNTELVNKTWTFLTIDNDELIRPLSPRYFPFISTVDNAWAKSLLSNSNSIPSTT